MKRSIKKPIFIIILSLAAFAIAIQLWENPAGLFTKLLLIVGAATVFYLVFRFFIQGRIGGSTDTRYSKAVKQSKKRYAQGKPKPMIAPINGKEKTGAKPTLQKRKSSSHLTVIEGKKGKKKNRAFF